MLQNLQAGWYGADGGRTKCHEKYPKDASQAICGHISLIELDGQMAYKQALAFWATGDEQYARNAFEIIDSWAKVGGVLCCPHSIAWLTVLPQVPCLLRQQQSIDACLYAQQAC